MALPFDEATTLGPASGRGPRPIFRACRPWIGLILAAATTVALAWFKPMGTGRLVGPLMLTCHAIGVVAMLTLVEEAISLFRAAGALRKARADGMADVDGWPRRMLADALRNQLKPADHANGLVGKNDVNQALDRAVDGAQEAYSGRWEIYRILAFVPPLLGLIAGWRDVKAETNLASFADVFQPLAVAWIEAGTWLALTTWLSAKSRAMIEEWRNLSEGLARPSSTLVSEILDGPLARAEAAPTARAEAHAAWVKDRRDAEEGETEATPHAVRQDEGPTIPNSSLGAIFDNLFASGGQNQAAGEHEDD